MSASALSAVTLAARAGVGRASPVDSVIQLAADPRLARRGRAPWRRRGPRLDHFDCFDCFAFHHHLSCGGACRPWRFHALISRGCSSITNKLLNAPASGKSKIHILLLALHAAFGRIWRERDGRRHLLIGVRGLLKLGDAGRLRLRLAALPVAVRQVLRETGRHAGIFRFLCLRLRRRRWLGLGLSRHLEGRRFRRGKA